MKIPSSKRNRRGKRSGQKRRKRKTRSIPDRDRLRQMFGSHESGVDDLSNLSIQLSYLEMEKLLVCGCLNPANAPVNSTQYIIDQHERKQADDMTLALRADTYARQHTRTVACFGLNDDSDSAVYSDSSPVDFYREFSVKDEPFEWGFEADDSWFSHHTNISSSDCRPRPDLHVEGNSKVNHDDQIEVYESDSSIDEMFGFMSAEFERLYEDMRAESLRKLSEQELLLRAHEMHTRLSCLQLQQNGKSLA
ncbi:hypothetical protein BaRGS_00020182 [Batillaria attramentaria]|uniref:Uncharacterized protein n=1 Tax=Batillaria attramentaria TaxID=370345 RepID=A0ABD0KMV9_9CAEN